MLSRFRTYQLAVAFYRNASTVSVPAHLRDQLRRAASSVVLNLSEGSAKRSTADRRRFYEIAFASHREVQAIMDLCGIESLAVQADQLAASLYCLRRSLS